MATAPAMASATIRRLSRITASLLLAKGRLEDVAVLRAGDGPAPPGVRAARQCQGKRSEVSQVTAFWGCIPRGSAT
ncbi:hypothetical protein Arub01_36280 [Actinomadura rubrobrunea]|uniref:Uncharacterized protein n=1 Tax=Actinomadura rubrobrunea TaxID=115335 RepID=A0A9W6PVS1_9ACTN|nr:hypothetical protein Arub01_36280 [Actinomadura rubrobrunea]